MNLLKESEREYEARGPRYNSRIGKLRDTVYDSAYDLAIGILIRRQDPVFARSELSEPESITKNIASTVREAVIDAYTYLIENGQDKVIQYYKDNIMRRR